MRVACIALLIAACLLVLADAWTTRRALLDGSHESNRTRRAAIRFLGINGGTFGVSAALCAVLVAGYFLSAPSPAMIVAYGAVAGVYAIVVQGNLRR